MLLDPITRKMLARSLNRAYPEGPRIDVYDAVIAARAMVEDVTKELSAVMEITGKPVRLGVARDVDNSRVAVGLVVRLGDPDGDARSRTKIIPIKLSRNICWIGSAPVFLAQMNGASDLMDAIAGAVESMIEGEKIICDGKLGSFAYQDYEDERN